jgi:hypothetical protein
MKNGLLLGVLAMSLMLLANSPVQAGPYAVSAVVHDSVMVSGTWSSVQWYESDGCYSGVGDPAVSDWKTRPQGNTPINISTNAGDAYGSASSLLKVEAPELKPAIGIHSTAVLEDVPEGVSHWASAYSEGGSNWLTSGATQTVTVTVEYSYDLDLTDAGAGAPYAFVKIYVAFWGPSGGLMLTPDAEFVQEGNYLVKTVTLETIGGSTGTVTGSKSWNVDVTNGGFYSFWGMAWVEGFTESMPVPVESTSWGQIKALFE